MPACPHCGETLLASSAAEFLGQGRIRHTWSCDECGHEFRTLAAALRPRAG
jgi:transcription elongation factor Elf1